MTREWLKKWSDHSCYFYNLFGMEVFGWFAGGLRIPGIDCKYPVLPVSYTFTHIDTNMPPYFQSHNQWHLEIAIPSQFLSILRFVKATQALIIILVVL